MIDLHAHTNKSDGTLTPTQLVDYACTKGLTALALTDHDTVAGVEEALNHAEELRAQGSVKVPEIIPGIELSTEWNGGDVHVVGLFVDIHSELMHKHLQFFIESRDRRNKALTAKLASVGIGISYEGLLSLYPGRVLTRAHFAKYLVEYGYVRSAKEAFERYIGPGCPCYVPREKVTPMQAVEALLAAGAVPVLAHPLTYRLPDAELKSLIAEMKKAGLVGIETYYCTHTPDDTAYVKALAKEYNLLLSGGSDYHGENKPGLDLGTGYGELCVPDEVLEPLRSKSQPH